MTYERFEDLPVWKLATDLAARMFTWTALPCFRGKGDLGNQLQRATLSISNNIAEGFERGTTKELLMFLYIARGSAGEVRSMLCVMERMAEFREQLGEIEDRRRDCESISRQIRGWTNQLQNCDIKGQRHLTDQSRREHERSRRSQEFWERQDRFRADLEERLTREACERVVDSGHQS